MTTLRTSRLTLRRPAARDWEPVRDFLLSERASWIGASEDLGRAFRIFAAMLGHWEMLGRGMFTVSWAGSDAALALVGPWTPADWPEPEIGWWVLAPEVEGKSVAFEAAQATLGHAWGALGWTTAVSYIAEGNRRSVALAERLGAALDPEARAPEAPGKTLLVYRHPRPAEAAA